MEMKLLSMKLLMKIGKVRKIIIIMKVILKKAEMRIKKSKKRNS